MNLSAEHIERLAAETGFRYAQNEVSAMVA
jgi:hypothetical protein